MPEVYGNKLYERVEVQPKIVRRSRAKYFDDIRVSYLMSQEKYIGMVLSSGIDFSAQGWSGQVAKIIGQLPQKVAGWMRKLMPEFYREHCFKRVSTKAL